MEFNSIEDLYERVLPALTIKICELQTTKKIYINEKDLFDELRKKKWMSSKNLTLSDIVNDILKYKK